MKNRKVSEDSSDNDRKEKLKILSDSSRFRLSQDEVKRFGSLVLERFGLNMTQDKYNIINFLADRYSKF